jgi:hypothetical protein
MADDPELSLDDLLARGRDWQAIIERPDRKHGFTVLIPMLHQYLRASNAALEEQRDREKQTHRKVKGGRPRGGMGDQVARLIGNGIPEEQALRTVACAQRKSIENVRDAYARVMRREIGDKNPPR